MHGDDLTATIGGHLAGLARGAEKAGRNDWRGADIRIRRAWNAAYLRDEIEITWEER